MMALSVSLELSSFCLQLQGTVVRLHSYSVFKEMLHWKLLYCFCYFQAHCYLSLPPGCVKGMTSVLAPNSTSFNLPRVA